MASETTGEEDEDVIVDGDKDDHEMEGDDGNGDRAAERP